MPASHAAGTADDRAGHHEGRESSHDRIEVGDAGHLVVLVGTVGSTLAVGVVLNEDDRFFAEFFQACHDALGDHLAGAVPQERIARTDRFGRGVLGVRVIDVQACAIREDRGRRRREGEFFGGRPRDALRTTGRCEVVRIVSEQRRVCRSTGHAHAAQVVERVLPRVVPADDARALGRSSLAADLAVRGHDRRRQSNRVCPRVAGTVNAVLGLGSNNAFAAHFTVPIGFTLTISGASPLVRAQSSGEEVAASSSDSFISSCTPRSR